MHFERIHFVRIILYIGKCGVWLCVGEVMLKTLISFCEKLLGFLLRFFFKRPLFVFTHQRLIGLMMRYV